MSTPNSWLFSDNSKYSAGARLLFMGLSFTIGILTFLTYLFLWYTCSRRRWQRRAVAATAVSPSSGDGRAHTCSGDRGMSADAIAALPTFAYEEGGGADCAVCLGEVERGEKVRRVPKCAHLFHAECIDAWLRAHSTCPICRAAVGPVATGGGKKAGSDTTAAAAAAAAEAEAAAAAALPPV